MLGKPQFKVGDKVRFFVQDTMYTGYVYIVDAYGTFDYPDDVSYDIMLEGERCLYKHIPEIYVSADSIIDYQKLVRVSTYAQQKGVSVQAIYKQIEAGKMSSIKIDGITFIEI